MMDAGTRCCMNARRRRGCQTRDGLPVYDLHRHDRGWRGYIIANGTKRYLEWFRDGMISTLAETEHDLIGLTR